MRARACSRGSTSDGLPYSLARPSIGCVRSHRMTLLLDPIIIFRHATVSFAGAPFVFEDRHIFVMQLSVLAQAPLVAHRRRLFLPLCRAPQVVDHPHADLLGLVDAVDVLQRSSAP
jgi:hypothetical protein